MKENESVRYPIAEAVEKFFKVKLHAQSEIRYDEQLFVRSGGSTSKQKVKKEAIEDFKSFLLNQVNEEAMGMDNSFHEESKWDEDTYIWVRFNHLNDGFLIYID